jgi:hypothetical protein
MRRRRSPRFFPVSKMFSRDYSKPHTEADESTILERPDSPMQDRYGRPLRRNTATNDLLRLHRL